MSQHEHFDELCALAINGDIGEDESRELTEHLQECSDCRETATDFHKLGLMLARAAEATGQLSPPAGMNTRFVARARLAGIPLSRGIGVQSRAETGRKFFDLRSLVLSGLAVAVLVAVALFAGIRYGYQRSEQFTGHQPGIPVSSPPAGTLAAGEEPELKEELVHANQQILALGAKVKQKELALESVTRTKDQLTTRLGELTATTETQQNERTQRSAEIVSVSEQLEKLRAEERSQGVVLIDAQAQLANEKLKTSDLESELAAAKEMNTTLGEARELITARNLHVKDIPPEIDGNGNSQRPFGRIFYAEGRRLDFYAYDLADLRKPSRRESFYVWKEGSGPKEHVAKLGRLNLDSAKESRWLLRVTDPGIVNNLKSVFVTLESDTRPVTQPTGQKILFAFLGNKANHP
ncbi:MAG TPA: hypothetical protein VI685_05765 [Candidatus Angelobacter sp.]